MADFDRYDNEGSGAGFMMGLLTGTVLGAGLGMLLAPKAGSELRGAIGEQARNFRNVASEQYKHARETAGTWAERAGADFVRGSEGGDPSSVIYDAVQRAAARERDLVLAMDSGHLSALTRHGSAQLFADADVPDPYYGDDAGFDDVLAQIEKAADLWVDRLR